MRTISALQLALLLSLSTNSLAAEVTYQHPYLTIVAKEEPLETVLKSLGREMRIFVTIPTGLNPAVNCDIHQQPVQQALKKLLGELSYSLEWEKSGERLVGLTILAGGGEAAVATASDSPSNRQSAKQVAPPPDGSGGGQGPDPLATQGDPDTPLADHDTAVAENNARIEGAPEDMEARMAEEQEAQEAGMNEEVVRHDAEAAAYLESQGIHLPQ
jgi:hypothetical protein